MKDPEVSDEPVGTIVSEAIEITMAGLSVTIDHPVISSAI